MEYSMDSIDVKYFWTIDKMAVNKNEGEIWAPVSN